MTTTTGSLIGVGGVIAGLLAYYAYEKMSNSNSIFSFAQKEDFDPAQRRAVLDNSRKLEAIKKFAKDKKAQRVYVS